MSRIGKMPVTVPQGVKVTIDNYVVTVEGKKGKLKRNYRPKVNLVQDGSTLIVDKNENTKLARSYHGLYRTLINNMVTGVT